MPYMPCARVIAILYPEGTATIATALRCLAMHSSSFVNAILLATKLDCSVDGQTRFVAMLCCFPLSKLQQMDLMSFFFYFYRNRKTNSYF